MIEPGFADSEYTRLMTDRDEFDQRAEKAAKVTIPSIFPPDGHSQGQSLRDPYQSFGARAVNTLASKIMLALFPPNTSFFRLSVPDAEQKLDGTGQTVEDAQNLLSKLEQKVVARMEQTNMRPVLNTAIRHLMVTGNGAIRVDKDGNQKFFSLRNYVVVRDPEGNILLLILKEEVSPETLDEETKDAVMSNSDRQEAEDNRDKTLDVFTVMQRDGNRFEVWQEINDEEVPGSRGSYKVESPPFIVLRWIELPDEDYGRGMVDEYYGDFKALDDLSRDLLKASAVCAKLVWLRNPSALISAKKITEAESGDVLDGREDDFSALTAEKKLAEFEVTLQRIQDIRSELHQAFLMHSSVQRDAERVTAEEVRFLAQELEDALGGVYSLLSHELQSPYAHRFLQITSHKEELQTLPMEELELNVTTGLEALGRGHDVQKLLMFTRILRENLGEEFLIKWLSGDSFIKRVATGVGLNIENLIKDRGTVMEEEVQRRVAETVQQTVPGATQEAIRQNGGQNNG